MEEMIVKNLANRLDFMARAAHVLAQHRAMIYEICPDVECKANIEAIKLAGGTNHEKA